IIQYYQIKNPSNLLLSSYSVYSLSVKNLYEIQKSINKTTINTIKQTWHRNNSCYIIDSNSFFLYQNFDSINSHITYKGNGAFFGEKKQYNVVCTFPTNKLDTTEEYILSYWYYNHIWDQTFNTAIIEEWDSLGNSVSYNYYSPLKTKFIDNWWYLSEYSFKPKTKEGLIKIIFKGDEKFENWFAIDELLIRPKKNDIYRFDTIDEKPKCYMNNIEVFIDSISLQN
ncbi:MAG: hypothetical protein PF517_20200, partial [Salinivirgaceae bacterium]|nr:hypothetical protein [Salinivirgaceae bacterium]